MADDGYNINPAIADASTFNPDQTVDTATNFIFSSPGSAPVSSPVQTPSNADTNTATATAAGGNATPEDSGNVGSPNTSGSSLSILDWILISIASGLALVILKKHLL